MGIDVSSFFNTGSSGSGFGTSNWLGDYASIKNGSYGKLMKAYYSEANSSVKATSSKGNKTETRSVAEDIIAKNMERSKKVETKESKNLTAVKKATDSLQESAAKLRDTDNSVFEKKFITTTDENGVESTEFGYDKEAIYNAVNDFVKNYNSVMSTTASIDNASIANRVANIQNESKTKEQALNQLGITIKADGTLSIDKDTFMKADMSKAEDLFGENGFYTRGVSESASAINYTANYEQLRANTYTYDGTFNNAYSSGSNYNSTL